MLLNDLLTLAQLGAQRPLWMWKEAFVDQAPKLVKVLAPVYDALGDGTETKRDASALLAILQEKEPNEYLLAKALLSISDVFSADEEKHRGLIQAYHAAVKSFYGRAQLAEFLARERSRLLSTLSDKERADHDRRLFLQEGMVYVLEFYLAHYKAIKDAPTEQEKRRYIEHREVTLESGRVPGIWADMAADDILEKFAYKILDDDLRKEVLLGYYAFKETLMKLEVTCDEQGSCAAHNDHLPFDEVMASFKTFLEVLLRVFQKAGIVSLRSVFYRPYGDKPNISDISL